MDDKITALKARRLATGLSLRQAGDLANTSGQMVSMIEQNRRHGSPRIRNQIASVFGLNPDGLQVLVEPEDNQPGDNQ